MKKLLILIGFIAFSVATKAQNTLMMLPETDGKITYEKIVDITGKTKDFIFSAANKWMFDSFKEGVQSADKEQGQILGTGGFQIEEITNFLNPGDNYTYHFKIQIDCKDNKYRVRLYDLSYYKGSTSIGDLEGYNDLLFRHGSKIEHENAYLVDAGYKNIMASLASSIKKAANDDF